MNKHQKKRFVKDLCKSIEIGIVRDIESGRIPDNWDGIELRWLLADRFSESSHFGDKFRSREYKNTVIVNNL